MCCGSWGRKELDMTEQLKRQGRGVVGEDWIGTLGLVDVNYYIENG